MSQLESPRGTPPLEGSRLYVRNVSKFKAFHDTPAVRLTGIAAYVAQQMLAFRMGET